MFFCSFHEVCSKCDDWNQSVSSGKGLISVQLHIFREEGGMYHKPLNACSGRREEEERKEKWRRTEGKERKERKRREHRWMYVVTQNGEVKEGG